MTARVLVVDDLPANVKLLEQARLSAEYFDVNTHHIPVVMVTFRW
jgi:two-component system cell cycle response regulator